MQVGQPEPGQDLQARLRHVQAEPGSRHRAHGAGRQRVAEAQSDRLARDIQRLETPGINTGRTIALTLGSLAVVAGVAVLAALGAAISASD